MAKNSSQICQRKATRYLKVPLTSTEQIYLVFLIPTLISCIIYIVHFSADLVVAIQHFRHGNPIWGSCTVIFIYAPAIVYFVLTVSRPDWWIPDDEIITKDIVNWLCLQIFQLMGFPFFALYRYAGLIVLAIDAIVLSGEERTKTLNVAAAPAAIELYFFLQAWFQAAPQAILQTHLLFREASLFRTQQSVTVQILCILMSIVVLAVVTASFQRFESQRVNGRKLPWAMWLKKYRVQELSNLEENAPLHLSHMKEENIASTYDKNCASPEELTQSKETTISKTEEKSDQTEAQPTLERQISITPPLPPKNAHIVPPPMPLRGITTVTPLRVPDLPAPPRPDSIVRASEQEEAETTTVTKSVSVVESHQEVAESTQSLRVPRRKYSSKGLEEDDPVGKLLAFLWWFFFILARVFAIAVFYEFYPYYLLAVLGAHYIIMLVYLFYHTKYYDVITFFVVLWLGLIYIFSVIEYRIKFKYADRWLLPYYVFVILQNISFTLSWYFCAEWEGFWYSYIFYGIFISMLLCISSSVVYHIILRPKKCRVYNS